MGNLEYIKKLALFSELDDNSLSVISGLLKERKYKKNMMVFMEGEPSKAVYFVKRGKVKIYKTTQEGKEHIIHIMSDGDVFAEACLLGAFPYPANVEALEDSEIYMIQNEELDKLLEEHPRIGIQIIKVLSKRLQMISKQVENLALRDAYGKTASLIIQLLKGQGKELVDGAVLSTDLSRQDMGNMVGLSRETFTRALSKLKQYEAVDIEKDEIRIISVDKLKEWIY